MRASLIRALAPVFGYHFILELFTLILLQYHHLPSPFAPIRIQHYTIDRATTGDLYLSKALSFGTTRTPL